RRGPDVSVSADPAELVHRTKCADGHEVFHRYVPGQGCTVHEQGVAANHAIMSDVRVRQKKIPVAQARFRAAFFRATAYADVFAVNVVVARQEFGALTSKRVVLRVAPDATERVERIVLSEPGGPAHR